MVKKSLTQHLVVAPHISFHSTQICVSLSSPQRANMPQTADRFAKWEDVNTWLRGTTDSLTPKTFELLLFFIIILILRRFLTTRFKPEQQPWEASQNHQLPKLCLHDPAETERQAHHPPSRGTDMCSTPHRQAGSESSRSTQSTQREGAGNNGTS